MYNINDLIMYKNGGVCRIEDICSPNFVSTGEQYYKLQPLYDLGSKLYVKISEDSLRFRSIISKLEAEQLLAELSELNVLYNNDEKIRSKEYDTILKSYDCKGCLMMLKGLVKQRNKNKIDGKRINIKDENYFNTVSRLLNFEFSVALNIPVEHVQSMLDNSMVKME